jgi:dolichyl-phosphate beta-glucosyltransferase
MGWLWPVTMMFGVHPFPYISLVYALLSSAACLLVVTGWFFWSSLVQSLNEDCCNSTQASSFEDPWNAKRLPVPSIHSEPCKSLTVVFPAYNESTRIDPAIEEAIEFLIVKRKRELNFSYEIIVVDDGSTDDTYEHGMNYVQKYGLDTFRVLRFPVNKGKGAAVRAGILAARGELILFADSDGATQFNDFTRLSARLKDIAVSTSQSEDSSVFSSIADKHGFVAGSRAYMEISDAVSQRQWWRNVMMHGFHFLVTLVAGKGVRDTQCGFKVCLCLQYTVLMVPTRHDRCYAAIIRLWFVYTTVLCVLCALVVPALCLLCACACAWVCTRVCSCFGILRSF